MEKTKFYKILVSLDCEQFDKLEFFLRHMEKARAKCIAFYSIIKDEYYKAKKDWGLIELNREKIHFQLFKKPYTSQSTSLREIRSEFYLYLKHYCAFIQFERDREEYFLKYLNEKGINDLFEKNYEILEGESKKKTGLDSFWNNVKLNELYSQYEVTNDLPIKISIEHIFNKFDQFSRIKKIQLYCGLLQHSITRNFEINETITSEIQQILERNHKDASSSMLFDLYRNSIYLLNKKEINYKLFKKELYQKTNSIDKYDLNTLYGSLNCYCIVQMRKCTGEVKYYFWSEIILNYFQMYNAGLLNEGRFVHATHVKNICTLAINRIKEKKPLKMSEKEVIHFIEESKAKTVPQYRESTYNFNLALLCFSKGNIVKAREKFEWKTKYANYFFTYDVKIYLMKCYFLLNIDDLFEKTIASFKQALRRDQFLSKLDKINYRNEIKAFEMLRKIRDSLKYKYRYNPESDIKKFENFLMDNPINRTNWLNEQLNMLKN